MRETLNERAFDTWFSGAVAQLEDDGALVLRVPNEFTRSWIESRFLAIVESAARECSPDVTSVRVEVVEQQQPAD
ncbi:MAG: DnaA N-terminal domain-containing protein, partial [Gaiellaceae bacterium]